MMRREYPFCHGNVVQPGGSLLLAKLMVCSLSLVFFFFEAGAGFVWFFFTFLFFSFLLAWLVIA